MDEKIGFFLGNDKKILSFRRNRRKVNKNLNDFLLENTIFARFSEHGIWFESRTVPAAVRFQSNEHQESFIQSLSFQQGWEGDVR